MSLFSLTDDELKAALFLFSPVVDSILNGVDVGVAQRRRPRSSVSKQSSKDSSSVSCSIIYHSMLILRYFFFLERRCFSGYVSAQYFSSRLLKS